jgi:hypothetical protein
MRYSLFWHKFELYLNKEMHMAAGWSVTDMFWSATGSIKDMFVSKKKPHQSYEPMSTLFRLAMAAFKPVGTKLQFSSYKLDYYEPWKLQGGERTIHGDVHYDLAFLKAPIRNAVQIYGGDQRDPLILRVFFWTSIALRKLNITYEKENDMTEDGLNARILEIGLVFGIAITIPRFPEKNGDAGGEEVKEQKEGNQKRLEEMKSRMIRPLLSSLDFLISRQNVQPEVAERLKGLWTIEEIRAQVLLLPKDDVIPMPTVSEKENKEVWLAYYKSLDSCQANEASIQIFLTPKDAAFQKFKENEDKKI